jgi:hypothetical protein
MHRMTLSALGAMGIALVMTTTTVLAQEKPIRVRGTIEKADGDVYTVKTRGGETLKIKLSDKGTVRGIVKASLDDIKVGSYIGISAMPQADGSQKAIHIHIFPAPMRGVAEGHRPWDNQPGATMTNAAVDTKVAAKDGSTLMMKYKGGEKKVVVPPGIPIVTYLPGSKDELKPGAKIMIVAAMKQPDGTYQAGNISVGRGGMTPPM